MAEALAIIRKHIAEAERDRAFHRGRRRGDIEALIASLKIGWLKRIEREMSAIGGGDGG